MASREKRPLAPSKSKQKVNNDCTLPTIDQKNKKGKSQTNTRQQQIAQDILESVATGSELPVKINASLPRKKAIKNLRRKPKLKTTKSNLIKVKITKKAPIRALRKNNVETIRAVKGRRTKKTIEEEKSIETEVENTDIDNSIDKSAGSRGLNTIRNSLKSKKLKYPIRTAEVDLNCITEISGKETEANNSTVINSRNSPKSGRKIKLTYKKSQSLDNEDTEDNSGLETEAKCNKACKVGAAKKLNKEKEDIAGSSKNLRLKRNTSKEREVQNITRSNANATDTKSIKAISSDNKNLIDLTIDEVVGSTVEDQSQGSAKKLRKGRKVSERLLSESEIKKEPDTEGRESDSETLKGNQIPKDMSQSSSDSLKNTVARTRYNRTSAQRSLRNGKLRKSAELLGISTDSENKQFKLDPEDQIGSDTCTGDSSIDIIEGESFLYEANLDSSQENMNSTKGENPTGTNERALLKNFEDDENNGMEVGNNNNGERGERTSEVGPMLRSKTKAKTTDTTAAGLDVKSSNDVKADEVKIAVKSSGTQDDSKKSTSIENTRKENILVNISDKPKSRRSSLNIEMKKTVGSFYGGDKSDVPKSQIDQMIENIKLNIAKSIESKIFGPEKSLGLNKNFEISKTEEIVAPLRTELQKRSLDDKDGDSNTPNISKSEMKSENSENAMPKVADTAKKIEKMVMGDMEIADTQSQKGQQQNSNDNSSVATPGDDLSEVSELENAMNPENIPESFSKFGKGKLQTGNCSSDLESNKNDETPEKPSSLPLEDMDDTQQHVGEGQTRKIDVTKKLINTRESGTSTERSSIGITKSGEYDKSQSLPETCADIEKGKNLLIVLDKTENIDEKSSQNTINTNTNGNESTSSNKNTTDCTLNYEIFKQELKDGQKILTNITKSSIDESELQAMEGKSLEIADDVRTEVMDDDINDTENDGCLNTTVQSEESETLESISREVERLVAESESDNTTIIASIKQASDAVDKNIDNRLLSTNSGDVENAKLSSETSNKNLPYDDFNDIVDTEAEANPFLEALESSFTDSDILNMAPEITEALVAKELTPDESVYSKESLDFQRFTQESAEDAERRRNDKTASFNYESTLNGQKKVIGSQNPSISSELTHENGEKSSDLISQSLSHSSNIEETIETRNLNIEVTSDGREKAGISRDEMTNTENINKNPQSSEGLDRSIENDQTSDVSGEISSEKQINDEEKYSHVSIETSCIPVPHGEDTVKKDSQIENSDKQITAEEQQKSLNEENKRVLRARDRLRKVESGRKSMETVHNAEVIDKSKSGVNIAASSEKADAAKEIDLQKRDNGEESITLSKQNSSDQLANVEEAEKTEVEKQEVDDREAASGPLIRTRRSREVKKRKDEQQQMHNVQKPKRSKRDNKKSDQQNKEETLLDNEVAKINENTESLTEKYQKTYKSDENFRGFSEGGSSKTIFGSGKVKKNDNDRSHSETDLEMVKMEMENVKLCEKRSEDLPIIPDMIENQSRNSETASENEKKIIEDASKTPETLQKDLDEISTSSESSRSAAVTPKILETPEEKVKKESILRLLGLESLEKAAERLNHQKAKKEQYTGTLKTVIRVQKEKDKKRSRSPLKMVLKQGPRDGDGDSPEFYTIQKELGTSGLGDSSSGANRKFSTNHRHSCDEDPGEEPPSKDRQSLVIPEKSSSFSIHPGRLCADVCCYCFGKFGSLDTPMHLAQMKSDERRKKILNVERHLTKDSCLCDACYRHVDRKANTSPTNVQSKPQRQHRQLMVSKCSARDCREPARHHVKRRWLLKIKSGLQNQVDMDWESSQHTSMSFCVDHYSKIERFLTCALCKRRLARNHTHQLIAAEIDELNDRLRQQGIPVPLSAGTYVCKLCRYFTQLQLKYKDIENMNANHKSFFKSYRKRILHYHDIEVLENEEEDSSSQGQPALKDKEKRKRSKCGQGKSGGSSKSLESSAHNSTSEKSTPEPSKNEAMNFEGDNNDGFVANRNLITNEKILNLNMNNRDDNNLALRDIQILNVEDSIENLKKRKSHDMQQAYNNSSNNFSSGSTNDLVEILAMDKEVTLTRLPKRARTNSDITPVVQRLGANPSISVRTLFPGEEEMNLHANVEFNNVREVTPQGWEKCATMIQYDRDTKLLWQELQRPYGNQSSFLRHLILLEKYYRSGDLVLAPNASRNAINYSTSVQNRLISYEGPEKVDEPILEPISSEFASPRRLSGGFMMERDRLSIPSTSSYSTNTTMNSHVPSSLSNLTKTSPPRIMKLNPGVSIIKKPPPNLHRLNLPSTSTSNAINTKRKDNRMPVMSGGKVFQLSEPEYKKLQNLKRQKQQQQQQQQMLNEKQMPNINLMTNSISSGGGGGGGGSVSPSNAQNRPATQYQKAQIAAQTQFQKHLRMQQEMLNRQSRSDFEPLICDVRSLSNENNPTQHLLNNLNLPKSIQVTTKPPQNTIPIMPKIPKSLTVIPQTITRAAAPTEK